MDIKELLKQRHSCRKYKDIELTKDDLDYILESMNLSFSGRRKNPWEFILVTDNNKIEILAKSKSAGSSFIDKSKAIICVVGLEDVSDTWVEDSSIALAIGHLAAFSRNVGSCWIQIRNRANEHGTSEDWVRNTLDIPKDKRILGLLAMGYPA